MVTKNSSQTIREAGLDVGRSNVSTVKIDSNVLLKIIKHCSELHPQNAAGALLGFDNDEEELEVSYVFPFPSASTSSEYNSSYSAAKNKTNSKYQEEMTALLDSVNVDTFPLGWYQNFPTGRFYSQSVVDTLLQYQQQNPNAILLANDPSKSFETGLSLRAYRLSDAFLKVQKTGNFTTETLVENNLSYKDVFQELEIVISNSHLATLFLQDLNDKNELEDKTLAAFPSNEASVLTSAQSLYYNFDKLKLNSDAYLEKNMESIFEAVDDFNYDQGNYNYYQRQLAREQTKIAQWKQKRQAENVQREAEGKPALSMDEYKSIFRLPTEPSRLDNLLLSASINEYCSEIEGFSAAALSKAFLVQKGLEEC